MAAPIKVSAATMQRRRLRAQRLNGRIARTYTPRPNVKTAGVLSDSLVVIEGRLASAQNAGSPGQRVSMINAGRPASARWTPADPTNAGSATAARVIYGGGSAGGGGAAADHTHPDYLTIQQADARYLTLIAFEDHRTNINAHHAQQHDLADSAHHTLTGATEPATFVGSSDPIGALQLYAARDDAYTYPGELLKSDAQGSLTLNEVTAIGQVITAQIASPDLNFLDLEPALDIRTGATLRSYAWSSGTSGAGIDFTTGYADFRTLTVDELIADSFTAAVMKALAGAFIITKSRSTLARPFTIPTLGQTADLHVWDIPGHLEMPVFETGDDAMIGVFQVGTGVTPEPTQVAHIDTNESAGEGGPGSQDIYENQNFESTAIGERPADWLETYKNNSLTPSAEHFEVRDDGTGNHVLEAYDAGSNYHIHWTGTGYKLISAYRITGRIMMLSDTGSGITFFSDYPDSDSYYRIRRYINSPTYHISPHGATTGPNSGTTDSGFSPSIGTWHYFKIEVEDTGSETQIRAKFWNEGNGEPGAWQINASDSTTGRYTAGTFGLWGYKGETQYDDIVAENLYYTGGSNTELSIQKPAGLATGDYLIAAVLTESTTAPTLAGFAQYASRTQGGRTLRILTKTATASEPASYTVTLPNATEAAATIVALRNQDTAPIASMEAILGSAAGASTTANDAPTRDNSLQLIIAATIGGPTSISTPAGMTKASDTDLDGSAGRLAAFYAINIDTGSPAPARAFTFGSATDYILAELLITPAAPSAGGGSAVVAQVWGELAAYAPGSEPETEDGAQVWQFTTTHSNIAGYEIGADSPVLDYGTDGDGVIEMTTLDPTGPYIQAYRRGADPWDKSQNTLLFRAGGIGGTAAIGDYGMYIGQEGDGPTIELSGAGAWIREAAIRQSYQTNTVLDFTDTGAQFGRKIGTGEIALSVDYASGNVTLGREAAGYYAKWNESTDQLQIRGSIEIAPGSTGLDNIADGTTYAKVRKTIIGAGYIVVGSGTKDSTLDGWSIGADSEIVGQLNGVDQIVMDTSGRILAGAGNVELDASGITIRATNGFYGSRRYSFYSQSSGDEIGYLAAGVDTLTTGHPTRVIITARSGQDSAGSLSAAGVIGLLAYRAGDTEGMFNTGQYPTGAQLWIRDRHVGIISRGLWIGSSTIDNYDVAAGRVRFGIDWNSYAELWLESSTNAAIFASYGSTYGQFGGSVVLLRQAQTTNPTIPAGFGAIYFSGAGDTLTVKFPNGTVRAISIVNP